MEKKKVVSIEDRIPKLKQARKKKANRRLLFYLSLFFFLISVIVYLQSPLSYIHEIKIDGNEVVEEEEILIRSDLTTSTNIWTINEREIESLIETHPIIETVKVKRKLPQTVQIKVTEHKIVGFINEKDGFHPLLANGNIVEDFNEIDHSEAPVLNNFTEKDYLERMASELNDTPDFIFDLISEISWEPSDKNKYKIVMYMNDGFTVHATIRNFSSKMEAYPSIVSQIEPGEKGIVHMGVGTYFEKIKE